ncbi:MAG: hypothetical protein N2595_05955 [bacterium]|nr:hypothetical protein [bacterium]
MHAVHLRFLIAFVTGVAAFSSQLLQAEQRGASQTNTVTVLSCWPSSGVEVQVSRPDIYGLRTGWTPFERRYPATARVRFTAPEAAESNSFHHWQVAKDKYLRTRTIRVIPSRNLQLTAVFLHAEGAASFVYRGTRRRDTLIATGFTPPLSRLFADGKVRGFGIRALDEARTPIHGPFPLQPYADGAMWMYNGAKERTAVIRCYPEFDMVVYVAYTNLPHEFELYPWSPSPTGPSRTASQ